MSKEKTMSLLAWLLVALGLCAPVLTTYFSAATPRQAGYASGRGYLLSIAAIVLVIALTRSMAREKRVRAYLLVSALVVAVNLWSSFNIMQGARIDREVAAARPQINAIMQAAATEAALINSGQMAPEDMSPGWQPYAAARLSTALGDPTVPLKVRLVELMRRAKSRELDLVRHLREEVDASGIGTALLTDRLVAAESRVESLKKIERYRAFMNSYVARFAKLSQQSEADIRALELPLASENEMISGRVSSARDNAAAIDRFVDQQLQAIDSVEAVIRHVDAHADTARVQDGQLVFSDRAVQAEYESMTSRLGLDDNSG